MRAGRVLGRPGGQDKGVKFDLRVDVTVRREGPVGVVVLLGILVADTDAGSVPLVEVHDRPERLPRAPVVDLHRTVAGRCVEAGIVPVVLAASAAPLVR